MPKEIERKYMLSALPAGCVSGEGCFIRQGYIFVGVFEIRIRQKGDRYFITAKSDETFCRDEVEVEIPRGAFDILLSVTLGRIIEKFRHTIIGPGGFAWEVDEFLGNLKSLFSAEVELPNEHTEAIMPESIQQVLISEVTYDVLYRNSWLATHGLPQLGDTRKKGRRKP